MLTQRERPVIPEVVRQHVEDAAFQWTQLKRASEALPKEDILLRRLQRRLFAHLDGAELAGPFGWEIATQQAADYPQSGEVFVLAWLALTDSVSDRLEAIWTCVEAAPSTLSGLLDAVSLAPLNRLTPHVRTWLNSAHWISRAAGLAACARHGQDLGSALIRYLTDSNPFVRAQAISLLAARQSRRESDVWIALRELLFDPVPHVRFEAALALAATGRRREAWPVLAELAVAPLIPLDLADLALDRAATIGLEEEVRAWVRAMANDAALEPRALRVVGIQGDSASWPWLIDKMERADLAEVAGLAACDMLGCDLIRGLLFTDDPTRLPNAVALAYDLDFTILPDAQAFRRALSSTTLSPAVGEERSLRARKLDRYRTEARHWLA